MATKKRAGETREKTQRKKRRNLRDKSDVAAGNTRELTSERSRQERELEDVRRSASAVARGRAESSERKVS